MEVGEVIGRAGKAAEDLGLDLEEIVSDPDKLEKYARIVIACVFAVVAWHQAPYIKARIYALTGWIQKTGKATSTTWDFVKALSLLTLPGQIAAMAGWSGNIQTDMKKYEKEAQEYPQKLAEWEAAVRTAEKYIVGVMSYDEWCASKGKTVQYPLDPKYLSEVPGASYWWAWKKLVDKPPKPAELPPWMNPSLEERAFYASFAFLVAMHPEMIGQAIHGAGTVLQGIGEIVPL